MCSIIYKGLTTGNSPSLGPLTLHSKCVRLVLRIPNEKAIISLLNPKAATWAHGDEGREWCAGAEAVNRGSWTPGAWRRVAWSCWNVPRCPPRQRSCQQSNRRYLPQTPVMGTCVGERIWASGKKHYQSFLSHNTPWAPDYPWPYFWLRGDSLQFSQQFFRTQGPEFIYSWGSVVLVTNHWWVESNLRIMPTKDSENTQHEYAQV